MEGRKLTLAWKSEKPQKKQQLRWALLDGKGILRRRISLEVGSKEPLGHFSCLTAEKPLSFKQINDSNDAALPGNYITVTA